LRIEIGNISFLRRLYLWAQSWHDFQPSLLKQCREDAIAAEISAPKGLRLLGNDVHEGALSLCKRDAKAANVLTMLELSCRDCRDYTPPATPSLVVVNSPWGARLGDSRLVFPFREVICLCMSCFIFVGLRSRLVK
jgi:23S rRNA G2445 N2-methylase RlmL